jgi:L-ascorbate metabolism protein UlaG (beta-lactamase superfamily)
VGNPGLALRRDASITVHATPATLAALHELLELTIPCVEGWLGKRLLWHALVPGKPTTAGDAQVIPFAVDHGLDCVGFRIEQGSSPMVFAADTQPCPSVVEYARGVELVVHEVYGPGGNAKQAHALGHSTAAEVGRAAREAKAGRLVLTHFRSARFVDPRKLAAEASPAFGGPVMAARDLDAFGF